MKIMSFHLINRIYTHKDYNRELLLWGQDLFFRVYLRTLPHNNKEESIFVIMNWWKFMFTAKYTGMELGEDNKIIINK